METRCSLLQLFFPITLIEFSNLAPILIIVGDDENLEKFSLLSILISKNSTIFGKKSTDG